MKLYLITFALIVVGGGTLVWSILSRRSRVKRFEDRDDVSLDSIFEKSFASRGLSKSVVFELWREVATFLQLPPGKLRPTDRFDSELSPGKGWEYDDEIADITSLAWRRLKSSGKTIDLPQITTLGEYVEFFASLESK